MPDDKPTVRVRPYSYQPSKAELEEDVSVEASPEDVRAALMRPVRVEEETDA